MDLPNDVLDLIAKSDDARARGDTKTGIALLEQALQRAPDRADLWNELGWTHAQAHGLMERVLSCYDKAIALNPRCTMAWVNKGIALKNHGRYDEALACYQHATTIPDAANLDARRAWYNLANLLWERGETGDEAQARVAVERALPLVPADGYARRLRDVLVSWTGGSP